MAHLTNRQAFNGVIELAFDNNGNRETIPAEKIIYIMIEHDYDKQVLPIIYIKVSVKNTMYDNIIKYKESAKFYLNIQQTNKNSKTSIAKNRISGTFNYIPATTNPNFREDLSDDLVFDDAAYKRIMIGLVSIELTNKLRKSFNGIYRNIDQKTLIGLALEGTKCVIETPPYNETYSSILVPPITSRYKMLEYIFNKDNYYDTMFRYFMDFDNSYLVSKRGDPISAQDGSLDNIIIDIRSVTESESYFDGIEEKNGAYYIYINPADSNVIINEGTEKVANKLVGVNEYDVASTDLEINNIEGSSTKNVFMRTENVALYKNELETFTVITEIVKKHIDGSIFTPNRMVMINHFDQYTQYNGKYLIMYKKEFYKCVAGEFIMSCTVGLKRIGNIQPAKTAHRSNKSGYSPKTSIKTTTATKAKTSTKASRK